MPIHPHVRQAGQVLQTPGAQQAGIPALSHPGIQAHVPQPSPGTPKPPGIPIEIPQPGTPELPPVPPEINVPSAPVVEPPPSEPALPIREPGTVSPTQAELH